MWDSAVRNEHLLTSMLSLCFFPMFLLIPFFLLFFKGFIYLFLERGEGREKERERNICVWLPLTWPPLGSWPTTQACALTGSWAGNPLIRSLHSIHWAIPARAVFTNSLTSLFPHSSLWDFQYKLKFYNQLILPLFKKRLF